MSKFVRTQIELNDFLNREYLWRFEELKTLEQLLKSKITEFQERSLIRSGVAIVYAHWEGLVKNSIEYYLQYISLKRKKHSELKVPFAIKSVDYKGRTAGNYSIFTSNNLVQFIELYKSEFNKRSNMPYKNVVNAKSNLSYEQFEILCETYLIPNAKFILKRNKINELVTNRNKIAHGEYINFSKVYFIELIKTFLDVFKEFQEIIIECAIQE
ncbi:MAE_28990/MAE_18760 family HEPN-like nuclease (plasmid) [Leptospira noguchii]|uniref:MAE_28990/MAE_18760 family HEPN-like nuclease n=1 Tax=Leptospira noguchii TaxID=28182 RepID=UPI001FB627C1|nr:MAE_28990/MAE_18760 family HEPN-like nuclease [Leptospira noguchii]UOG40023.1 MAE_28990/MAE_18760 family HEPN-like nuclease [Leptospira noguchii]